jgi:hypothetical protein
MTDPGAGGGKSVADLEAELRRLLAASRMPPSACRQLLESYASSTQLPDAAQREKAQRTFLVSVIGAYRNPEFHLKRGEDRSVSDLTRIAMTMPLKAESLVGAETLQRHAALTDLLAEYEQERYAPEDRDFYRRLALASFIAENAADPGVLESREWGTTIESLRADELRCPRCGAEDVDNSQRLTPQSGNSGDWITFSCRKCGHREEALDGDIPASSSPWFKRRG